MGTTTTRPIRLTTRIMVHGFHLTWLNADEPFWPFQPHWRRNYKMAAFRECEVHWPLLHCDWKHHSNSLISKMEGWQTFHKYLPYCRGSQPVYARAHVLFFFQWRGVSRVVQSHDQSCIASGMPLVYLDTVTKFTRGILKAMQKRTFLYITLYYTLSAL